MQFKIFAGNTFKTVSNSVFEYLNTQNLADLSVKHYIIVPDSASMSNQLALQRLVGEKSGFSVEVKTVNSLANLIIPKFTFLSSDAALIALTKILNDNREKLTCFTKSSATEGFVKNIYDVLCQLRYNGISVNNLDNLMLPKSVKAKIDDIKIIYKLYVDFLEGEYLDIPSKLDQLIEYISQSELVKNSYFYLLDFDEVSVQFERVIKNLIIHSRGLTLGCVYAKNKEYLYLNDIFDTGLKIASKLDIRPEVEFVNNSQNAFSLQIEKYLFSPSIVKPLLIDPDKLFLYTAESINDEVFALACYIKKLVITNSARFKDIYVVCPSIDKYRLSINSIFTKFEIPNFIDDATMLITHELVQFILDGLNVYKNNFQLNSVLKFTKNFFFDNSDDIFTFENFCYKYNVSYNFENFGIGTQDELFATAEVVRQKFIASINNLKVFKTAKVNEYINVIKNFVVTSDLENKLASFVEKQLEQNSIVDSKVSQQVLQKLQGCLDEIQAIMGDSIVTTTQFIDILTRSLSTKKISVIPQQNDEVVISDATKNKVHDIKILCVIGAVDGEFPVSKGDFKLLNDTNISVLKKSGIDISPAIATENIRAKFVSYMLLCEPTQSLYFSYPSVSLAFKAVKPSAIFLELSKLFTLGEGDYPIYDTFTNTLKSEYYLTVAVAKLELHKEVRKFLDNEISSLYKMSPLFYALNYNELLDYTLKLHSANINEASKLFFDKKSVSISKIEKYLQCPYRHFLTYGVKLKKRLLAKMETVDTGNILHRVLELYLNNFDETESDLKTINKVKAILKDTLSLDRYKAFLKDKRDSATIKRIETEGIKVCQQIKNQIRHSSFKPYKQELSFGYNESPIEIKINDITINLVGKIDRIDKFKNDCILFDYKTGQVAFNEKSLYLGEKLQLIAYIKAIKSLGINTVGTYYYPIKNEFEDEQKSKKFELVGRTVNNMDILNSVDHNFLNNGKSEMLGVMLLKSGEIANSKKLITKLELDSFVEYAFLLIEQSLKQIYDGYIEINPMEQTCEYCEFVDICGINDTALTEFRDSRYEVSATVLCEVIDNAKV